VTQLDGLDASALALAIGSPRVEHHAAIGSTMDRAHELADDGAPSGTVVIADEQRSGRGRLGRKWESGRGQGLWVTTIHRGVPISGLDVLSIRIGLQIAPALDPFVGGHVGVKWPNDLLVGTQKLGGILVEARWRDIAIEWVAVGIGINVARPTGHPDAAGLQPGARRSDVLRAIFPAVLAACAAPGELTPDEMHAWADRDALRDVSLLEPAPGLARGITANGALIVETVKGKELFRRGTVVRAPEAR
jgi:BirA family biotin operon repressor/biotin-[acetyl-CoA-carboxylase] ligase